MNNQALNYAYYNALRKRTITDAYGTRRTADTVVQAKNFSPGLSSRTLRRQVCFGGRMHRLFKLGPA